VNELRAIPGSVALLTKTFPKLSETFVLREILGLERRGHALRIYALAAPEDAESQRAAREVRAPVAYVPRAGVRSMVQFARAHALTLLAHPIRYVGALLAALRREESHRTSDFLRAGWLAADLRCAGVAHLHVHFASEPAAVAELAARMAGVPYSISAHAKDIYLSSATTLRRKLTGAAFTVTCTEHNRTHLAAIAPRARVLRMHHGVDVERLQVPTERVTATTATPLVLSVGRLRAKKGFRTLIEACALLRATGCDFRVQIVGYGPDRAMLESVIAEHRLQHIVELTGKLDHDEVVRRYAVADLFVLPCTVLADGDRDGIPNVLLEAMAMALPVISTAVSGIPELVADGRNGVLVPPERPALLAAAMQRVLSDAVLRSRLGAAARATVQARFSDRNLDTLCRLLPGTTRADLPSGAEVMHAGRI
jgi:glycosyltransferase involved in cell wall biosynthesis